MEYIITPIWVFIDLSTILTFSGAFLYKRGNQKISISIFIILWLFMSGYTSILTNEYVEQLLSIGLTLILLLAFYKGSWQKYILCATLGVIFIGVIDILLCYGMCTILGISFSQLIWRKLLFVMVATIAKAIELLLAYIFNKFLFRGESTIIRNRWFLLTLLFPVSSLFMMIVVFLSFQDRRDLSSGAFIYSCVLLIANIAIIYLINIMEKRTREEQQLILLNQQMDVQTKNIVALEKSYCSQRKVTHEFTHQLQTISDLLDRDENCAARQYIQHILGLQRTKMLNINSHHPILDAILNQKYQWATEQGIEMHFQINDLSKINIGIDELVVLFSNLLDNAIEACMRLPNNRTIKCNILCDEDLYISIRNTTLPVMIVNGLIETSKEPKLEHGFGLPSIQHILANHQAEYAYDYHDGWFHFVAEIPLSTTQ